MARYNNPVSDNDGGGSYDEESFRDTFAILEHLLNRRSLIDHGVLRLIAILIGGGTIFLGYDLFIKGVSGEASIMVKTEAFSGQLVNAMPGIFYTISGMIIILISLFKKEEVLIKMPLKDLPLENRCCEHVPRQDGEHVPRQDGDHVPRQDGDHVPRQDGDHVPKQDGEQTLENDDEHIRPLKRGKNDGGYRGILRKGYGCGESLDVPTFLRRLVD